MERRGFEILSQHNLKTKKNNQAGPSEVKFITITLLFQLTQLFEMMVIVLLCVYNGSDTDIITTLPFKGLLGCNDTLKFKLLLPTYMYAHFL